MTTEERRKKPVIHVRVMAPTVLAEDVASKLSDYLEGEGYEVLEQTGPQPTVTDRDISRVYVSVR